MVSKCPITPVSEIREQGCSERCRHVSGHTAYQGQSWTQTQVLAPQPAPSWLPRAVSQTAMAAVSLPVVLWGVCWSCLVPPRERPHAYLFPVLCSVMSGWWPQTAMVAANAMSPELVVRHSLARRCSPPLSGTFNRRKSAGCWRMLCAQESNLGWTWI